MSHEDRTQVWTLPTLKKETAIDFQKMIRLEAADINKQCECITCGKSYHWKTMHAGHWRSRKHNATLLEETNCHPQCVSCNNFEGGMSSEYSAFLLERYGADEVARLIRLSNEVRKFTREELLEQRAGFRKRWKIALRQLER